jgi:hypothetical protein
MLNRGPKVQCALTSSIAAGTTHLEHIEAAVPMEELSSDPTILQCEHHSSLDMVHVVAGVPQVSVLAQEDDLVPSSLDLEAEVIDSVGDDLDDANSRRDS